VNTIQIAATIAATLVAIVLVGTLQENQQAVTQDSTDTIESKASSLHPPFVTNKQPVRLPVKTAPGPLTNAGCFG